MNDTIARIVFEEWAAQFVRPEGSMPRRTDFLRTAFPHTYAPAVPVTLRGPKWGTR
ncbi:hypothetical protein [Streptomyces fulvorobeus]|uniref:Uncharacterized protein n=1 Tax=Streptomyces fulvorobeus TaxID=284028 RepID=A0A7J0CFQ7_9ACTN|nr:hypothetical protein [Streptomyces fulvorobeus]NYE44229.1 hypothetical protein [Streptomyces fulvorobeus]GFN00744.1 hypothetical protein Sfulv_55540 [Streptomyces fulvorobeus]